MNIWVVFIFLQLLDILTTILFFMTGAKEGMPTTRWFMGQFGSIGGLAIVKILALALLVWTFWKNKRRPVIMANYAYFGIIGWNISIAIITLSLK